MNSSKKFTVRDFTKIALCTTLIILCAWIKIPFVIPYTMQSFGIAFAVCLLGGKRSSFCILLYILAGVIGLPVFSGFTGGIGILFGATGGYIFGFIFLPLCVWLAEKAKLKAALPLGLSAGLLLCYITGTLWYLLLYVKDFSFASIASVTGICVFPFILPDILKLSLAFVCGNRLNKYIK